MAVKMVQTCCVLYNFLLHDFVFCPPEFSDRITDDGVVPGSWRGVEMENNGDAENVDQRASESGKKMRDCVKDFLNTPQGALEWQNDV